MTQSSLSRPGPGQAIPASQFKTVRCGRLTLGGEHVEKVMAGEGITEIKHLSGYLAFWDELRGCRKAEELWAVKHEAELDEAQRVAKRIPAVLLNYQRHSRGQTAAMLAAPRSKVSLWLQQHEEHGWEALREGHRSGRPGELVAQQRQGLADILDRGPVAYGFMSGVWTSRCSPSAATAPRAPAAKTPSRQNPDVGQLHHLPLWPPRQQRSLPRPAQDSLRPRTLGKRALAALQSPPRPAVGHTC